MPKIILYIAQSLDGYIATPDGGVSWLGPFNTVDYGYAEFLSTINAVIMGSKTYEQVLTFGPYPYADKRSYIHTKRTLPKPRNADITMIPEFSKKFYSDLDSDKTLWLIGGSRLILTFMEYDLISEYQIFTMPVVLGSGIPLFPESIQHRRLRMNTVKSFPNGVVLTTYSASD